MGATVGTVDTAKFALDLEGLWTKFNSLDPEVMLAASGGAPTSDTSSGSSTRLDEKAEQEATGFLLDLVSVSRDNGLKLPREFGLLIKQQLYFDRYTKILAPTLDPLRDSRMQMKMKDQEGGVASGEDVLVLESETEKGEAKPGTEEGETQRLAEVGELEDKTNEEVDDGDDGRDGEGEDAQKSTAQDQDVGNEGDGAGEMVGGMVDARAETAGGGEARQNKKRKKKRKRDRQKDRRPLR
ncbi:unnamed protein product [Ectocarpus fasciculatus]